MVHSVSCFEIYFQQMNSPMTICRYGFRVVYLRLSKSCDISVICSYYKSRFHILLCVQVNVGFIKNVQIYFDEAVHIGNEIKCIYASI